MIKLNGIELKQSKSADKDQQNIISIFPDGTSQCWKLSDELLTSKRFDIEWEFESEAELIHICQLVDILKKHRHTYSVVEDDYVQKNISKDITLHIPYLPYARQDKDIANDATFALHTFANIINQLKLNRVTAYDTHSNIAQKLINHFQNIFSVKPIAQAYLESESNCIVFPDEGAKNRYAAYFDNTDIVYAKKVREQLTGEIKSVKLSGDVEGKNVLIVDDLCDGGGTFIKLAELLYLKGANKVNLYTSHGIYSGGLEVLKEANILMVFNKDGRVY